MKSHLYYVSVIIKNQPVRVAVQRIGMGPIPIMMFGHAETYIQAHAHALEQAAVQETYSLFAPHLYWFVHPKDEALDKIINPVIPNITLEDLSQHIEQIRKSLVQQELLSRSGNKIGLYGHSICGALALHYALQYPENALFVVLEGTPPYFNEAWVKEKKWFYANNVSLDRQQWLQALKITEPATDGFPADVFEDFQKFSTAYANMAPTIWYDYKKGAAHDPWHGYQLRMPFVRRVFELLEGPSLLGESGYDCRTFFHRMQTPVHVNIGIADMENPPYLWCDPLTKGGMGFNQSNIKRSHHIFTDSGHWSHIEQPLEYARALQEFVNANVKKSDFVYDLHMVAIDGYSMPIIITPAQGPNDTRPVCFIVGLATHYLDKFSDKFLSNFRLIYIDLYWTQNNLTLAFSDEDIKKLTLDKIASHINLIQKSLIGHYGPYSQYKQVFIAGHSMYGLIAMNYAYKYPDAVSGVIAIGTPYILDTKKLDDSTAEYLQANFKSHPRYEYFQKHANAPRLNSWKNRDSFVKSYVDLSFSYWKSEKYWQNQENAAQAIWHPWSVSVKTAAGEFKQIKYDLNLATFSAFIKIFSAESSLQNIFREIKRPVLWFVGLYDIRVSLIMIDDAKKQGVNFSPAIEFYYIDAGHWPMYSEDGDTTVFDEKCVAWSSGAVTQGQPQFVKYKSRL